MKRTCIIIAVAAVSIVAVIPRLRSQMKEDVRLNKEGVEYGQSNRLDEAIRHFDRAIQLRDEAAAKVYHNRGYAYELKGDLSAAIKSYEEAWKRNPRQIVTGERLGFAYYRTEDYERAVEMGEAVLKLDPENKEVPRWLPDAYRKRMEKRQEALLAEEKRRQEEKERREREEDAKRLEEKKKEEERRKLFLAADGMLRTGAFYGEKLHYSHLYYTSPHGYRVLTDPGALPIPLWLVMKITPVPFFEIDVNAGKPWLGGQMPNFIDFSGTLEFLFHIKSVSFGAGAMATHYDSTYAFHRRYKLWDPKVGFIFAYRKDGTETRIRWYPRMLIMDPKSSTGKSLDVGALFIDYTYQVKSFIAVYALIHARDYYVFCHSFDYRVFYGSLMRHSENVASYWGVYDIGLGVSLTDLIYTGTDFKFNFAFEWIERFYLRKLEQEAPYTLAPNGQGWFGLDLRRWSKGKPFSGFHALSQVLGFRFEEELTRNFFMYQKIILELADQNAEHHEFNFLAGFGVKI